jgi:hypothetical protein
MSPAPCLFLLEDLSPAFLESAVPAAAKLVTGRIPSCFVFFHIARGYNTGTVCYLSFYSSTIYFIIFLPN